jgi:nucleoid-associated protein YgaU
MPVEPGAGAHEVAAGEDGVRIIPPEFGEYAAEKGDTAWTISEVVYGTPGYARRIMNANPLTDFTRLYEGQKIRWPKDPANVQGLPADGSGKAVAPEPAHTEYIVQRNDTLTGIAKALYGKASYWTRIRDANPGKINQGGTNIRPGMTILIPPPPNQR